MGGPGVGDLDGRDGFDDIGTDMAKKNCGQDVQNL